jgi:archaemetzincin
MRFCYTNILISILLFIACSHSTKKTNEDSSIHKIKEPQNDTIQIVCLDFKEKKILQVIKSKIESYYHCPTVVKEMKMPESFISPLRHRYEGIKIIAFLKNQNIYHYRFVAGLTSKDICHPDHGIKDWGVFGLGSRDGSGCISSTCRLKKGVSKEMLTERLEKVVLHEIGHNHGLNHCVSPYPCFMKAAEGSIQKVDKEPMDMCVECKKKINF